MTASAWRKLFLGCGMVESYFKPLWFLQPPHLHANGLDCTDPHIPLRASLFLESLVFGNATTLEQSPFAWISPAAECKKSDVRSRAASLAREFPSPWKACANSPEAEYGWLVCANSHCSLLASTNPNPVGKQGTRKGLMRMNLCEGLKAWKIPCQWAPGHQHDSPNSAVFRIDKRKSLRIKSKILRGS